MAENRLFIGGLNSTTMAKDLVQYFSKYGPIIRCSVILNKDSTSRRFGYVSFDSIVDVKDIIGALHFIDEKCVDVKQCHSFVRSKNLVHEDRWEVYFGTPKPRKHSHTPFGNQNSNFNIKNGHQYGTCRYEHGNQFAKSPIPNPLQEKFMPNFQTDNRQCQDAWNMWTMESTHPSQSYYKSDLQNDHHGYFPTNDFASPFGEYSPVVSTDTMAQTYYQSPNDISPFMPSSREFSLGSYESMNHEWYHANEAVNLKQEIIEKQQAFIYHMQHLV